MNVRACRCWFYFFKKILHITLIGYAHVIIKPRLRLLKSPLFIACYFTSENVAFTVQAGFKLKNEEFRPEYQDLENGRTEKLINKIEGAVSIFTSNS